MFILIKSFEISIWHIFDCITSPAMTIYELIALGSFREHTSRNLRDL
jgi:hypothetical protein